jgi:serine phosphatase RsbU (regulator of sigma subunit)
MPKDSTLIIHTDGVTDALNEAGEQYGDDRLRAAATVAATLPSAVEVGQFLQKEISAWSEGQNFDDATFVILSLSGNEQTTQPS